MNGGKFSFSIRAAKPEDAKELCAIRTMEGVFDNTSATPFEPHAGNEKFIAACAGSHMIVAVTGSGDKEAVIGMAVIFVSQAPRASHGGALAIMVHRDYQNRKVGTALMEKILDLTDNWLMLVRTELEVFTDNECAVKMYEKFGFVKEGVKRLACAKNGRYSDILVMGRIRPDFAKEQKLRG